MFHFILHCSFFTFSVNFLLFFNIVPFQRTVTSGKDSIANFDDGGDSSDEEDEYDWVEVVAMSCEGM